MAARTRPGRRGLTALVAAALLLTGAGVVTTTKDASAYTYYRCAWPSYRVTFDNTTSGKNYTAYYWSVREWAAKTRVDLYEAKGSSNHFLTAQNYGAADFAGVARTECDSRGYTFNGTAALNVYFTDRYTDLERQAVATHEMGHTLGLNHSARTTIMYEAPVDGYARYPKQDDIDGVNSRY